MANTSVVSSRMAFSHNGDPHGNFLLGISGIAAGPIIRLEIPLEKQIASVQPGKCFQQQIVPGTFRKIFYSHLPGKSPGKFIKSPKKSGLQFCCENLNDKERIV
jgi:hypothetical protein